MRRVEIIERLKNLTEPSSLVDAEVAVVVGDYKLRERDGKWAIFDAPFERGKWAVVSGCKSRLDAIETLSTLLSLKRYTASLDAAVALVEKMLPGWSWSVDTHDRVAGTPAGWAWATVRPANPDIAEFWRDTSSTPAIALLLALFRALEQKP